MQRLVFLPDLKVEYYLTRSSETCGNMHVFNFMIKVPNAHFDCDYEC